MKHHFNQTRFYGDFIGFEDQIRIWKKFHTYKARVESTKKAQIILPIDSSKTFVEPLFFASVGEAVTTGTLVVAFLTPVIDDDVAEVFVAALSRALSVNGGGGLVNDAGYGAVSVRIGDWLAL
jgi:hypothetical protein